MDAPKQMTLSFQKSESDPVRVLMRVAPDGKVEFPDALDPTEVLEASSTPQSVFTKSAQEQKQEIILRAVMVLCNEVGRLRSQVRLLEAGRKADRGS